MKKKAAAGIALAVLGLAACAVAPETTEVIVPARAEPAKPAKPVQLAQQPAQTAQASPQLPPPPFMPKDLAPDTVKAADEFLWLENVTSKKSLD